MVESPTRFGFALVIVDTPLEYVVIPATPTPNLVDGIALALNVLMPIVLSNEPYIDWTSDIDLTSIDFITAVPNLLSREPKKLSFSFGIKLPLVS